MPPKPTNPRPKLVLIAHQDRIPGYRVPFYTALENQRPPTWRFEVITSQPPTTPTAPATDYPFPTRHIPTSSLGPRLQWQPLHRSTRDAHLLILDTWLQNLGYPIAALAHAPRRAIAYWGHTSNLNTPHATPAKRLTEALKRRLLRRADHFFAYTPAEHHRALHLGLPSHKITTIHNTIDIEHQRRLFLQYQPHRAQLRQSLGFTEDQTYFLIVARLLPNRRLDFLLCALQHLPPASPLRVRVIGDGPCLPALREQARGLTSIDFPGAIYDEHELARNYAAADAVIAPGPVGLAALEAISHDLPVIHFDLPTHGPEAAYLTPANSYQLPGHTTPAQFASYLQQWAAAPPPRYDESRFESISHLTISQMAAHMITGINAVLHPQSAATHP